MIGLILFVLCGFEFIKIMQLGYYIFQNKINMGSLQNRKKVRKIPFKVIKHWY